MRCSGETDFNYALFGTISQGATITAATPISFAGIGTDVNPFSIATNTNYACFKQLNFHSWSGNVALGDCPSSQSQDTKLFVWTGNNQIQIYDYSHGSPYECVDENGDATPCLDLCLDGSAGAGNSLLLVDCDSSLASQAWYYSTSSDQLKNGDGYCMENTSGSMYIDVCLDPESIILQQQFTLTDITS